jgi:polyisoprenyl-phosphate glycosyltransferase
MNKDYDYSIVIPVFCNEESLEKIFERIIHEIFSRNPTLTGEIIFVDDGSNDASYNKLLDIKRKNTNVNCKVIKLTRNFGQVFAIMAGYEHAQGRCIINLAADLQDPPKIINAMLDYYFNGDIDIVIGVRDSRDESFFRKITSMLFYLLVKKLSFNNMPIGGFDIVLIKQKIKDHILGLNDSDPFWQGQILWTGFKTKFIYYKRQKRLGGKSKWTLSKKIKYLIDGILGYSFFPIRMITISGIIISLCGFIYSIYILVARLYGAEMVYGWAPLMIAILLLGGFQILMLGVIGEYVWRTLSQVRNRPKYIIDEIIE